MASFGQKFPLAASVTLFLATTALSQWIHNIRKDPASSDEKEFEKLRRWYRSRRVHDRLSYEDLQKEVRPGQYADSSSRCDPSTRVALSDEEGIIETEWNKHHRTSQKRAASTGAWGATRQRTSMLETHPNADSDFHPKNRNWRHFEHFNEEDRKLHLERVAAAKIDHQTRAEEEDKENSSSYDDAQSISSEGSGSSEEQFVWMKHHHRASHPVENSKEETWPEAIRNRLVPAGLTNLLSNNNHEGETQFNHSSIKAENIPNQCPLPRTTRSLTNISIEDGVPRALKGPFQLMKRMLSFSSESSIADDGLLTPPNQILRAQYNARIMPNKCVMIRHGQSMGNTNELLYSTIPDNAMPLTDLGWEQAREAGKILKEKILSPGQTVHFIVSPYVRTVETFHGIVSAWSDPKDFAHILDKDERIKAWYGQLIEQGLTWIEDSRIREQDFGNYQDPETIKRAKHERHRFGVFYYRFPHGESASDVFDRVSTFLDSLWRSFEMNRSRNYVLVTHGISIRVLLARYFRYTIDQFNILANPTNCEMVSPFITSYVLVVSS